MCGHRWKRFYARAHRWLYWFINHCSGMYTDDGGINESHISDPTDSLCYCFWCYRINWWRCTHRLNAYCHRWDDNGMRMRPSFIPVCRRRRNWRWSAYSCEEHNLEKSLPWWLPSKVTVDSANRSIGRHIAYKFRGAITILGTPTVGNELTTTIADEDGASGNIAYQWYADDTISGNIQQLYGWIFPYWRCW